MLAPVVARHDALRRELLVHAVHVRAFLVDLVDGDDDGHLRGARVVDRLDGLRHHTVVGCHHQDDDVRDLRPAGAHRGEGFVTRRVDEHHRMPVGGLDLVRADPLGDAARLARRDARLPDGVEDRRLAVVDVAQHCHDRRADHQLAGVLVRDREELLARGGHHVFAHGRLDGDHVLAQHRFDRVAELVGDDLGGGEIDDLVDGGEDPRSHQLLDHLDRAHAELLGEVLHREGRGQHDAAVAVGFDLHRDGGRFEGRTRSFDRSRRQRRGGVAGQPALLEKVHQLFLADPKFACEFV